MIYSSSDIKISNLGWDFGFKTQLKQNFLPNLNKKEKKEEERIRVLINGGCVYIYIYITLIIYTS